MSHDTDEREQILQEMADQGGPYTAADFTTHMEHDPLCPYGNGGRSDSCPNCYLISKVREDQTNIIYERVVDAIWRLPDEIADAIHGNDGTDRSRIILLTCHAVDKTLLAIKDDNDDA